MGYTHHMVLSLQSLNDFPRAFRSAPGRLFGLFGGRLLGAVRAGADVDENVQQSGSGGDIALGSQVGYAAIDETKPITGTQRVIQRGLEMHLRGLSQFFFLGMWDRNRSRRRESKIPKNWQTKHFAFLLFSVF